MIGRMDKGSLIQVDRTQLVLKADGELLSASVLEPISLMASTPGMAKLPPAAIQLKLSGDLGGWQRRGQLFAGVDPGVYLGGRCELEATGAIDTKHVELTQASLNAKSFAVQSGATRFVEPQVVGTFQGQSIHKTSRDAGRQFAHSIAILRLASPRRSSCWADDGPRWQRCLSHQSHTSHGRYPKRSANTQHHDGRGDITGQAGWQLDPKNVSWVSLRISSMYAPYNCQPNPTLNL